MKVITKKWTGLRQEWSRIYAQLVIYYGDALLEKPYFYTFLQNGKVPPDNNRAENAIRRFAIGR